MYETHSLGRDQNTISGVSYPETYLPPAFVQFFSLDSNSDNDSDSKKRKVSQSVTRDLDVAEVQTEHQSREESKVKFI